MLGLDCAERDDLGDSVITVFLGDVTNDFRATTVVEVDIDIWHRDAFRVQEALEDQPVHDRVEVSDAKCVCHDRTRSRTTTGSNSNPLLASPADEVGHHKKVARETHLLDDLDLIGDLLGLGLRNLAAIATLHAFGDLLFEPGTLGMTLRHRELRHQ